MYYLYRPIEYGKKFPTILIRDLHSEGGKKFGWIVKWIGKNFYPSVDRIEVIDSSPLVTLQDPSDILKEIL